MRPPPLATVKQPWCINPGKRSVVVLPPPLGHGIKRKRDEDEKIKGFLDADESDDDEGKSTHTRGPHSYADELAVVISSPAKQCVLCCSLSSDTQPCSGFPDKHGGHYPWRHYKPAKLENGQPAVQAKDNL